MKTIRMGTKCTFAWTVAASMAAWAGAGAARADTLSLPQSGSCSIEGPCLSVESDGPLSNAIAASAPNGTGVSGIGAPTGVYGRCSTTGGNAIYGDGTHALFSTGVFGIGTNTGVYGTCLNSSCAGVTGDGTQSLSGTGVSGQGGAIGVFGQCTLKHCSAISGDGTLVVDGTGVKGSGSRNGVVGECSGADCAAVFGQGTLSPTGTGVWGTGSTTGVLGQCNNAGCNAISGDGTASSTGTGVAGVGAATGVYGHCTGANCNAVYADGDLTVTGNLTVNGMCIGCTSGSDARLKKNVRPIAEALDQLLRLRGVTYEWIEPEKHANETGTQHGFIAQEIEKVFPNWVHQGSDGFKSVDYRQTEALEVESIRLLKLEVDELKARLAVQEDTRRRGIVATPGLGGLGLAVGGLAVAGAFVAGSRRKRENDRA
jgi:hypothetical protein